MTVIKDSVAEMLLPAWHRSSIRPGESIRIGRSLWIAFTRTGVGWELKWFGLIVLKLIDPSSVYCFNFHVSHPERDSIFVWKLGYEEIILQRKKTLDLIPTWGLLDEFHLGITSVLRTLDSYIRTYTYDYVLDVLYIMRFFPICLCIRE